MPEHPAGSLPRDGAGHLDVRAAPERSRPVAGRSPRALRTTPTLCSPTRSESVGCVVRLELADLRRTGSFKLRGAMIEVLGPTEAGRWS